MSTVVDRPPDAPPVAAARRHRPSARPACAGAAVLLAGAPVGAVVQGGAWWAYAAGAVLLVVLVGTALQRVPAVAVAAGQLVALTGAITATFTDSGVLRVVPGPVALGRLGALFADAGTQIRTGIAPVPATPAMLLLVSGAFGLTTVAVHAVAVEARAPAAAGVVLLAVFAVPTALADGLLPAWVLVAAAAGFGLLLLSGSGTASVRRAPGGIVLTAVAVVLALGVGALASGVGTAGRLSGSGAGAARAGEIGLSPFTALRGQLQKSAPTELFRVTGLPHPAYLRALTLSSYVRDSGWEPSRPGPGIPLTGPLPGSDVPGDRATVQIENVGFRDYWLPLLGLPLAVDGVADDQWAFDPASGTAYSTRPRREDTWRQSTLLPAPSADELRAADGVAGVDPAFLTTDGIDPRVAAIATRVTAEATTGFDRAVALTRWFTGPDSAFTYDLSTAPGNGDDAMVEFLTRGRRGYCEQFASSMAAMLRTVGVPARVAVGFTGGRDVGGARSVSTSDAHAWVEAWFPGVGWTTFDPTPLTDGRALVPPYVAEATDPAGPDATATAEPETAAPQPAPDPSAAEVAPDAVDTAPPAPPDEAAGGSGDLRVLFGLATFGGLVALTAVPAFVRARRRRRRIAAAAAGGPGAADAAWAELLAESADRGAPSPPTDTVRGAARRMAEEHDLDEPTRRALRIVVGVVEESWYGGTDPAPGALTGALGEVHTAITTGTPVAWVSRLLPPSVVDGLLPRLRRRPRTDEPESDDRADAGDDAAVTRN
jgi:transglutaminase-like putative cysteine protease